jgi:hypothetical protein
VNQILPLVKFTKQECPKKSGYLTSFVKVFQGKVVAREESAEGGQNPAASRILVDGGGGATCATLRGFAMNALPRPFERFL